jgi:hypothetical protein
MHGRGFAQCGGNRSEDGWPPFLPNFFKARRSDGVSSAKVWQGGKYLPEFPLIEKLRARRGVAGTQNIAMCGHQ